MRTFWGFFLAGVCAFGQEAPLFQTDVSLVQVDAQVATADGRIIDGLTKNDFRVLDQGKEQKVLHFSNGEENLDLILLFDISDSMRPVVQAVSQAAREGLQELRPGDRVAVMVFNTSTQVLSPFTEDLAAVERTVMDLATTVNFTGGTYIQTAAEDAAKFFLREKPGKRRRAVLMVTDNVGLRTRQEIEVVRNYWEADALLSGLIVRDGQMAALRTITTILGPQRLLIEAGMKGIAEKTGGDTLNADDPGTGFRDAMRRIRSRYSLYYATPPATAGETRSIRVQLNGETAKHYPKARVRARSGYVAGP